MNIPIKRWLLLTHRWLGIGLCLFFLTWFVSGMVMMYVGYPKLTHAERLHHLPTLDANAPLLSPRQAFGTAGINGPVSDLRLTASRAGQPVYTALLQSGPDDAETAVAVDARTGRRLPPASQDVVLASARTYLQHDGQPTSESAPSSKPDQAEPALTYEGTIDEDPHTHSSSPDPPLD